MALPAPYPILLRPAFQDYIWGGQRIRRHYHPEAPEGILAEAWEVSDRMDGMATVRNGPLAGQTLHEIHQAWQEELYRPSGTPGTFPLLVKMLDAAQKLSLQVHPHDGNAVQLQGEAKSEMWYLLDAAPDAFIYLGFTREVSEEEVRTAIETDTLEQLLVRRPVQKGDVIFVPGGTVHAIGPGCLILEVQQNSNTTYRLYDWGRTSPDGVPRALHIDQGLRAMNRCPAEAGSFPSPWRIQEQGRWKEEGLLDAPWFSLHRISGFLGDSHSFHSDNMEILFCAAGTLRLHAPGVHESLGPGDTVVIPASLQEYQLQSASEDLEVLRIFAG